MTDRITIARNLAQIWPGLADVTDALSGQPPRVAHVLDVLAYDVADAEAVAPGSDEAHVLQAIRTLLLPDAGAYLPHVGDACPAPAGVMVAVDLGDGAPLIDRADHLYWGPALGPANEGRVLRWAPV